MRGERTRDRRVAPRSSPTLRSPTSCTVPFPPLEFNYASLFTVIWIAEPNKMGRDYVMGLINMGHKHGLHVHSELGEGSLVIGTHAISSRSHGPRCKGLWC
jgi:hypothetical protein